MTSPKRAAGDPGRWTSRLVSVVLAGLLLLMPLTAGAQEAAPPAEPEFSAAEVDALVRTIEDPEQRAKLVEQLKMLKATREAEEPTPVSRGFGATLLSALSAQVEEVSRGFTAVGQVILAAPSAVAEVVEEAGAPETRRRWLEFAIKLAIVIGVALVAGWMVDLMLARPRRALESRSGDSLWVGIPMLVLRAVLVFLPIAAFGAAAYGILPLTDPRPATRIVALIVVNACVIARVVHAVAGLILAPAAPALRLPRIDDESAHYAYIWVVRLTAVSVYGYFFAQAALLLGLSPSAYELLLRAVGLVVAGMLVVLILQNRVAVADWLRGRPRESVVGAAMVEDGSSRFGSVRHRFADVWHVLAIIYVAATYGIWALDVPGGFAFLLRATVLTAVVLGLLRLLLGLVGRVVRRGFALSSDVRARYPGLEARANRYLPALERLIKVVLYLLAALWLLEIWGVDSFGWLESDFGRRLTGSAVTIVVIVLLAAVLLEIVDVAIQRYLAPNDAFGRPVVRTARARTLLPLMRNAMRVLLAVMVTLIVLSELGINIAPLLAGAGVVGLAIGFGAQTLVKDIITGFFILAEDTVSVGDVIDIGGAAGVVEAMTIRSIRLRDANGAVHTIPFSAVTTVKNMTKDFGYAKFDVGVSYNSNVDEVIEIMREVADEMRADEEFRNLILSDLEVWGLDKFADSAIVVVARLKTVAGKHWPVTREFNRRLKRLFDERGIEIPFPQRVIHTIPERSAGAKEKRQGAGAPENGDLPGEADGDAEDEGSPAR